MIFNHTQAVRREACDNYFLGVASVASSQKDWKAKVNRGSIARISYSRSSLMVGGATPKISPR